MKTRAGSKSNNMMRYIGFKAFFVCIVLFALPGVCAWAACDVVPLELGQEQSGQTVDLDRGQELQVLLKENPSTGYTWNIIKQDPALLELVRQDFLAPDTKMVGAPGKALFVFKAAASGAAKLELKYYRVWEGEQSAAGHFQVTVRIE